MCLIALVLALTSEPLAIGRPMPRQSPTAA